MRFYHSPQQDQPYTEGKCTVELGRILETSPKVARLLQAIFALNKDSLRRGITCRPCAGTQQASRMGYYDGQYKRIVICCDNIHSEKQLESTLVHELVHAFDRIRTGTFSTMCHLIACGEIRASALGQCHDIQSPQRKRECIWEDAIRSTAVHCGGRTTAEMYIRQVFDKCVQDRAPFNIAHGS